MACLFVFLISSSSSCASLLFSEFLLRLCSRLVSFDPFIVTFLTGTFFGSVFVDDTYFVFDLVFILVLVFVSLRVFEVFFVFLSAVILTLAVDDDDELETDVGGGGSGGGGGVGGG